MQRRFDFKVSINSWLWATRVSERKTAAKYILRNKWISEFIAAGALNTFFTAGSQKQSYLRVNKLTFTPTLQATLLKPSNY